MRQSLKLTAPQINSAAHSWLYQSPKWDDYFSSNIFSVGNREWSNLSFSSRVVKLHVYIYLSVALAIFAESQLATHHTFYRFTKIITNSRCSENCVTGKVCESLASYLWLTNFRVFPQRCEWAIMLINRQKVRFIAFINKLKTKHIMFQFSMGYRCNKR